MRQRALGWCDRPGGTGLHGDLLGYAISAALACGLAAVTGYYAHRVWGISAALGYLAAAGGTALLLRHGARASTHTARRCLAAITALGAIVVPLAVLVAHRADGRAWSAQPEVGVVERAATALLTRGTTYPELAALQRPPQFEDYVPYLPGMALFGLPRALAGAPVGLPAAAPPPGAPWTDPRLWFGVLGLLAVAAAVYLLISRGRAAPTLRAVQLAVLAPPTALAVAVGGDDVPVLAALALAFVLADVGRPGLSGVAAGAALALKLSALPAVLVLALMLRHTTRGSTAFGRFVGAALAVVGLAVTPVIMAAPGGFVEHAVRYPVGLTDVRSPARSPLPGYLLAQLGEPGAILAVGMLTIAAVAVLAVVLRRPPSDAAGAATTAAAGMAVAVVLMPATRFGYVIYPLALLGIAVLLRSATPCGAPAPGCLQDTRTRAGPTFSSPESLRRDRAGSPRTRTAPGERTRTSAPSTRRALEYSRLSRTSS